MDFRKLSVGLVTLGLFVGAGALALAQPEHGNKPAGQAHKAEEKGGDEEVITLDKAPEAVRAAAIKLAGDAKNITKVIKEEDGGAVQYEVEYNDGAMKCSGNFSTAGDLMESEKGTSEAKVPAAVMAALKKKYPGATFTNPSTVTEIYYEFDVTVNGKKHEAKVTAAGGIKNAAKEHDEEDEKNEGKKEGKKEKEDDDDKD